jgi:hypothetical protein
MNMAVDRYDPLEAPDAAEWLATDEQRRIDLAPDYHRRLGIEVPNAPMHAMLHAVVENQIALGDETPVRLKARQLMAQGLDRHQAIHAIASVLFNFMRTATGTPEAGRDPNARYYAALARLNARRWLRSG